MDPKDAPSDKPISANQLENVGAISAIGLVAARMLQQHGIVTLMVNADGVIEVVPDGELELDLLPEYSAISALVQKGYTDEQLIAFLKQRDCRLQRQQAKESGL